MMRITAYDTDTGETQTTEIAPNNFLVFTSGTCEISSVDKWANGTVQITLKHADV